ncbi:MAG: hypothetical protein PVJ76_02205 [Gemmatimonadota bacterium]
MFTLTVLVLSTIGLGGQVLSAQETSGDWGFTSLPLADLWFHGMALVDPVGPGPLPLYDPGYPPQVRRAREAAGVSSTDLSDRVGYFRRAFQQDEAFQVLHFLPLYFPQAGRTEVFSALTILAGTEEGIPGAPSARTAFGLVAVASVLTTPGQRRVLGEFVQALEEEWTAFFRSWNQAGVEARNLTLRSVQASWTREFGPALQPFLQSTGMRGGLAAMSPAIGIEGRIFAGSPENQSDNVLVISTPDGPEDAVEAIYSMLRELSFPIARRAIGRAGGTTGVRSQDESRAGRAAVRAGAFVLETLQPQALAGYQQFFLSRAGRPAVPVAEVRAAFEQSYPLEASLAEALKEEIKSTRTYGGDG